MGSKLDATTVSVVTSTHDTISFYADSFRVDGADRVTFLKGTMDLPVCSFPISEIINISWSNEHGQQTGRDEEGREAGASPKGTQTGTRRQAV